MNPPQVHAGDQAAWHRPCEANPDTSLCRLSSVVTLECGDAAGMGAGTSRQGLNQAAAGRANNGSGSCILLFGLLF